MLISDDAHRAGKPNVELAEPGDHDPSHRRLLAGLTALAFVWRLYFVLSYPYYTPDSWGYDHLAQNWLYHHVLGLEQGGRLTPLDFRLPGYPAFLAVIYLVAGVSVRAVMLTQAALDTATCLLAGRIARSVAPRAYALQAEAWTVAIAALCPFLAGYSAAVLSEVPATFFLTAALAAAIAAFERGSRDVTQASLEFSRTNSGGYFNRKLLTHGASRLWLLAGALTGIATLIRPESGLIVVPIGFAVLVRYRQRSEWPRQLGSGVIFGLGLGLTLVPWTIRNAISLHEFQPLAPRYANSPGEFVPLGYNRWVRTWITNMDYVDDAFWKLNDQQIQIANLPNSAFDSPAERARVAALLDEYNKTTEMSPAVDQGFAQIAAERIRRHPLRYYLTAPARRAVTMWFRPRVETLGYEGGLWPPREMLEDDWRDFSVSLSFAAVNVLLVGLAALGLLVWRRQLFYTNILLVWILFRTAYLTSVETPEPRYVIECYPAVFVFAALGVIAICQRFRT